MVVCGSVLPWPFSSPSVVSSCVLTLQSAGRQYEQLEPGSELPREAWRLLRNKAPPRIVNTLTSSVQAFSTMGSHLS